MDNQITSIIKAIDQTESVDEINGLFKLFLENIHSVFSFEQIFIDPRIKDTNISIENSLKSILNACGSKIGKCKKTISQYEDDLRTSREKLGIVRFENELSKNKIHELTDFCRQLQSFLTEADTQVNLLHSDILYLLEENKFLADSLQRKRLETAEGDDENFDSSEDKELEIANYKAEINRLRHDIADQSVFIERLRKDLKIVRLNNGELEKEKQELAKKIKSLKDKKRKLKEENHFLKEELKTGKTSLEEIYEKEKSEVMEKENKNQLLTTRASIVISASEDSEIRERKFSLLSDVMSSKANESAQGRPAKCINAEFVLSENNTVLGTDKAVLEDNYLKMFQSKSEEEIRLETDEPLNKRLSYTDLVENENVLVKWDEGDFPRLRVNGSQGWSSTSIKELSVRKMESYKNARDGTVLPSQRKLQTSSPTQINLKTVNETENGENVLPLKGGDGEVMRKYVVQARNLEENMACNKKKHPQANVVISFIAVTIIVFFFPFSVMNSVLHKLRRKT